MAGELRKSSPSGHNGSEDPRSRGRDLHGSMGRAANAIISNYEGPNYGSVKKVMPLSRDPTGHGEASQPVFSSKPADNYQSMEINAGGLPNPE